MAEYACPIHYSLHRWKEESLKENIKRHEHFLALQLGLRPGIKVLDVGCGIGGPSREIAWFSRTCISGLNNKSYQITRGIELNKRCGLDQTCGFVKGDFMAMPFADDTYDAVYVIEATCHALDPVGCKIKAEIELGNGLPDVRTTAQCLEAVKAAGFKVLFF